MSAFRHPMRVLFAILVAAAIAAPAWAAADPDLPALDMWDDPAFQKKFLGSYGINSEIEPSLTSVEKETLREVLPLLSSDLGAAVTKLEEVTTPESSALFDFTLGNVHFQQGNGDEAMKHYEAAIDKFPSFRRAHKNLGLIRVRNGAYEQAISNLSKVIELGGGDGLVYGSLGYAYMNTQQYVSAESAYRQAVLLERETMDWKLGLTQSVFKQSKYAEAVALTEELIKKYPDRADFWLLQGNAYIGLGKPLEAAENFELVQRMGEATPRSLKLLGDIYVNREMWDLATRAYGLAVAAKPDQPMSRPLQWVKILAQRGAFPQAQRLLDEVKDVYGDALDDADRKELLKLEARLALNEGEGGEAVEVLEQIVDMDPLDGEALMLLGQHYAGEGDVERAAFYYERAQNVEGVEAEARLRHAQLLVDQGQYEKAIPLLKRVQELDPRDDVAQYLEQVQRVARSQQS